jgi:hypothetical protein
MKLNIDKKYIVNVAKKAGKLLSCGLLLVSSCAVNKELLETIRYSGKVSYNDAIDAIVNSPIYSGEKHKMIELVKKDGDSDYYRSVINIVKSTMFSTDKIGLIREISKD